MKETLQSQIMELKVASVEKLQSKYKELFKVRETPCDNKVYLFKRIAYKLQKLEYGGISEKAKTRIKELLKEYDPINNKALRPEVTSAGKVVTSIPSLRDKRLPIPGTVMHKKYKDQEIQVRVLEKGFEYKNKYYKSLTAISEEITDSHWSGYDFFNL
ncbi:MAG: DUF2924 domain-containing protein [Candidatus Zapsychrus exili]|nr:DUF2924 domain-containing protein [Candidatus Zapsychrus exili]